MKINGELHQLWRADDHEGEILERFVTSTKAKNAALKFLRRALKRHRRPAETLTDRLRSDCAALKTLGHRDDREMR